MAKKKTKKKTTRASLVARAAKRGPTEPPAESAAKASPRKAPAAGAPAGSAGALQVPGLQAGDIQETVRNVVTYVQQNPLGAAAVAIGVGVMLTSMYREKVPAARGKTRASG